MERQQGALAEEPTAGEPTATVGAIGRKAGRGLRWTMLGNVANRTGSFVMGLVLARLLVPADFGMYALALAAMHLVMHVNDMGIIGGTVQWRGKLEDMAPTAATMAALFSVATYATFWVITPYYAELAGSPEATPMIRLLTACILIDGVTAVRAAALMRRFQQDRLTMANLIGFPANACLAITLAASGAGGYAFVWGQLANTLVTGVFVFRWARIPVRFGIEKQVAVRLLKFGVPFAAGLGIEAILINAGYVVVGNELGAEAVGYYLLAFNISSWIPTMVGTAIRYVSLPGFSRLAEHESETLLLGVQRSVSLLVAAVMPVAAGMAALAPGMITVLYGAQWLPAADVVRILSVLMVARMVTSLTCDVLSSTGASRLTVWLNLGWLVALVPALLVGVHLEGIRGAAIASSAVGVLVGIPLAAWMLHLVGVRLGPIPPALVRPLLGGVLAAAVMLLVGSPLADQPFVQCAVAGSAGLVVYILVVVPRQQLSRFGGRVRRLVAARGR